jgi:hypothetical protein
MFCLSEPKFREFTNGYQCLYDDYFYLVSGYVVYLKLGESLSLTCIKYKSPPLGSTMELLVTCQSSINKNAGLAGV